jgi:hypothetical protein
MQQTTDGAGPHSPGERSGQPLSGRLADVSAEIAAAGAHGTHERHPIKANNEGLIGVTVKCRFSGRELDIPVSLELYEDLDAQALQNYLADAARRLGACEPISETHRLYLLPDTY